jgi:hypothetical protein
MAVVMGSIVVANLDGAERVVILTDGYGDSWQGFSPFSWQYQDHSNNEWYDRGGSLGPVSVTRGQDPDNLQEGEFREVAAS